MSTNPNNLMPYLARVANGDLPCLNVFGDDYDTPDGTGVRDYLHVMDLAEGHLAALEALSVGERWPGLPPANLITVNLGTGRGYSVLEMVAAFEAASGRAIPRRLAPRRPGDIAACYARTDQAAQLLGWQARRELREMCASAWKFTKGRKPFGTGQRLTPHP